MSFLQDSFTDAAGTALVDHVGEVGAAWAYHPSGGAAVPAITATGELRHGDTAGYRILYASGVPAGADYDVSATFRAAGSPGGSCYSGIWARLDPASGNGYLLQYAHGPGQFELLSLTGGGFALLGSWVGPASAAILRVVGDAISVLVGGATVISATNSDHASAGRVGVRFDLSGSDATDGIWIDSLEAGIPTLTISPSSIAPGEALGTPHIIGGTHAIRPPGIAPGTALGTPRITTYITHAGAIDSTLLVGRPRVKLVGQLLRPAGIASSVAVGEPTITTPVRQRVKVPGIPSGALLGAPAFALVARAPLGASGIAPSVVFGAPLILTRIGDAGGGSVSGAGGHPVAPKNVLIDRVTREVYPWPVNHATEDPLKGIGRQFARSGRNASGFLIKQPSVPGPVHLTLKGNLIDRQPPTQYQTFVRFFRESDERTFDYLDAAGDVYHVVIVQFDARRKNSANHQDGTYFEYTLEAEVIEAHSGPLKGYAV